MARKLGDEVWRWRLLSAERHHRRLVRLGRRRRHHGGKKGGWLQGTEYKVSLPEEVSLRNQQLHRELTRCLSALRHAFLRQDRTVCIDFSGVKLFWPEGMLLFFSELSRLVHTFPDVPKRCVPTGNARSSEVLEHLGIYKMLGFESSITPTREDVVRWRHCQATSTVLDEAGALIEMSQQLDRLVSKRLFGGVSEAVANVADHAYIGLRKDGIRTDPAKTWWMFCREMDEALVVCVCDLGVGIPGSLPLKYPAELIREFVNRISKGRRPHDGRLIQSAMALARSRTDQDHRGKGFRDMRGVVDATPGATLHVFSNRGVLKYKGGKEKARSYQDSILGTVVIWSLPLTETEEVL